MTTARTGRGRRGISPLAGLDLVACLDGPMTGQWFTRVDWLARIDAARYLHEDRGQRRQPCLDYAPGPLTRHPTEPAITGHALLHRPGRLAGRPTLTATPDEPLLKETA